MIMITRLVFLALLPLAFSYIAFCLFQRGLRLSGLVKNQEVSEGSDDSSFDGLGELHGLF